MPQQMKTVGIAMLVALTTLGAGYLWGARGRWAAEERLVAVERQASLSEARRLVLAGQLSLTRLNFGEAAGFFESARTATEAVIPLAEQAGQSTAVPALQAAGAALGEARGLAAKLDQAAFGRSGDALAQLDKVAALPASQP